MADFELTKGAIKEIRINTDNCVVGPVLQCLSTKKVGTPGDRYRAIVSDGECFIQAMFATQMNPLVEDGSITKNCVFRITEYTVNAVKERTIMIIHRVDVLGEAPGKIGEPASVEAVLEAEEAQNQPQAAATGNNNGGAAANPYNAAPRGAGGAARGGAANGGGRSNAGGQRTTSNTSNGSSSHPIYPIEGLSPYQNKWTIKARCTSKSDVRHWSNQKGEGKLFSFNLLDDSGEIKVTGFNDAVDNFYNLIEEGKVYFLSKARIGIAKKQFNNVANEYEITLDGNSEISLCTDTENVPQVKYDFIDLSSLDQKEPNSIIDVIAVVKDVAEISQITSKATQKPITKRELTLVDSTGMSVRLTLWGRQAENFNAAGPNADGQPIIAFKGVRVGDFNGRSLSMVSSSSMMVDPDIGEAHALRGWYDSQGANTTFNAYANTGMSAGGGGSAMRQENFRLISEVKNMNTEQTDDPVYFCVRGQFVHMKKETLSYPACPGDKCGKKVHMEDNDNWRCEKCDRSYPAPDYRYVLNGQIADFTGFIYISAFNEAGQVLMGETANEMERLKEQDEVAFNRVIERALGNTWELSIRAKTEVYNDTPRVKYQILKAVPASWSGEKGKVLMNLIDSYGE